MKIKSRLSQDTKNLLTDPQNQKKVAELAEKLLYCNLFQPYLNMALRHYSN